MSYDLESRRHTAERIAREAGKIALQHFKSLDQLEVEVKGRQDYVSQADREVEAAIRALLEEEFPGEGFLGEETGGEIAEPMWVVDPIDGTTNFLRGIPLWGISIAWVAGGKTQVGVIHEPALDAMTSATADGAATLNGRPLELRPCNGMSEAIVAVGYSERSGTEPFIRRFPKLLRAHAEFRRLGAATVGLLAVAKGQTDAFHQAHLSPWDVLAGLLIAERAGAVVKDFLAEDGLKKGNVCFAAHPSIASELAEMFEVPMPPSP